eukprot:414442_1
MKRKTPPFSTNHDRDHCNPPPTKKQRLNIPTRMISTIDLTPNNEHNQHNHDRYRHQEEDDKTITEYSDCWRDKHPLRSCRKTTNYKLLCTSIATIAITIFYIIKTNLISGRI